MKFLWLVKDWDVISLPPSNEKQTLALPRPAFFKRLYRLLMTFADGREVVDVRGMHKAGSRCEIIAAERRNETFMILALENSENPQGGY